MSNRHHYPLRAYLSGAFVMLLAFAFCLYSEQQLHNTDLDTYPLQTNFVSIGGLEKNSDVAMGGVKIGHVTAITLNKQEYMASVSFVVDKKLKIPTDSLLTIGHASPLARDALLIEPGHATSYLEPKEQLKHTQEPITLEQQISNYIFGLPTM